MPKTAFANQWQRAMADYAAGVKLLTDNGALGLKAKDVAIKTSIEKHARGLDNASGLIDWFDKEIAFSKSGEVPALMRRVGVVQATVTKACKKARLAFLEGTEAPANLIDAASTLLAEIEKKRKSLIKARTDKVTVATVALLTKADIRAYRNVDPAKVGAFVVEVEMRLPPDLLDDLAAGVEGVGLATFHDEVQKVINSKYKRQALNEVEFVHLNVLDFSNLENLANANLRRLSDKAGDDCIKAIEKRWATLARGRDALKSMRISCAKKITYGILSLSAVAVAGVASFGAAAVLYAKIIKDLVTIALEIKKLAQSAESAAKDVQKKLLVVEKALLDGTVANSSSTAQELLSILGVPFLKTCKAAEDDTTKLLAKTVQLRREATNLLGKAETGLKQLDHMERVIGKLGQKDSAKLKTLAKLRDGNQTLIEKTQSVLTAHQGHMDLVDEAERAIKEFKAAQNPNLKTLRNAVDSYKEASGAKTACDNLAALAGALV